MDIIWKIGVMLLELFVLIFFVFRKFGLWDFGDISYFNRRNRPVQPKADPEPPDP